MLKGDDTIKNYLFDLEGLIKEYALAAVAERQKQSDRAAQEFYDGYVQGFHRVVSLEGCPRLRHQWLYFCFSSPGK